MELLDEYECNHFPGQTLTVTTVYSKTMGAVTTSETNQSIVCSKTEFSEPSLCFAHLPKKDMEMRKKQAVFEEAHKW